MAYDLYPAVDETYNFPVEIRRALAASNELKHLVIPMTTTLRNNLTVGEKWDGRTIANTTTDRLERYDEGTAQWYSLMEYGDVKAYVAAAIPGRNRIINGDFSVNQRGAVSGNAVGLRWGFDRWLVTAGGVPDSCWYHIQASSLGELPESAKNYAKVATTAHAAAGDYALFMQNIEDVRTLSGKSVTISFWAKCNTGALKVGVELQQKFGTSGSPDNNIAVGAIATSTSWTRYSISVVVPSISGKVVGANSALALGFWTSSGATYASRASNIGLQNGEISFWGVQIEEGLVATVFEQKRYDEELRACQYYYWKRTFPGNDCVLAVVYVANEVPIGSIDLPVRMRKSPSVSFPGNGGARWVGPPAASAANRTMEVSQIFVDRVVVFQTATITVACAGWMDMFTIECNAEL